MDIAAGIDSIYIYRDSARTQGQFQPVETQVVSVSRERSNSRKG